MNSFDHDHSKPIKERIEWLLDLAKRHSAHYSSPEQALARQRYLAEHPTAIQVLKCMDGRVNIPVVTKTPVGILSTFRNLGGRFDLGWPHLSEVMTHQISGMVSAGRRVLTLISYHYSQGSPQRGCAGFNYDTAAAMAHTLEIRRQIEFIFGSAHGTVYPLVIGLETDEDALVIHGSEGQKLELANLTTSERATLHLQLAALLPDMPAQMRADLLPLLQGNLEHIDDIRAQNHRRERTLDIEHREWMICLGRGFDFLHTPNVALIIGPYSPNLSLPIHRAAGIVQSNMEAGRIPDDGLLVLASVPYDEIGVDRARAEMKSRFLARFGAEVIRREHPDLATKMTMLTAVLDWRSRELELLGGE